MIAGAVFKRQQALHRALRHDPFAHGVLGFGQD
jgi:hypothetical protein